MTLRKAEPNEELLSGKYIQVHVSSNDIHAKAKTFLALATVRDSALWGNPVSIFTEVDSEGSPIGRSQMIETFLVARIVPVAVSKLYGDFVTIGE